MKKTIAEILSKAFEDITIEDLINCVEKVRENGDVAVFKLDGQRKDEQYTAFITCPDFKGEMIRADESSLKDALLKILKQYILVRK